MGNESQTGFESGESLRASEGAVRALMRSLADAAWEAEPSGRVASDSPSWRSLTGQSKGEWLESGWLPAVHPEDRERAERQWRRALEAEQDLNIEFRLRCAGGGWRWTNLRVAPLRDDDGSIRRWFAQAFDIDDRKEAEQAAEKALHLAEETVHAARQPMLVLESDLRVRSANRAFYERFGGAPEEAEGRLVYNLAGGQWDMPRLRQLLEDVLPENSHFEDFEVEHEFEGLGRRSLLLSARRIDHLQLILLAIEDVTEALQREQSLREREHRYRTLFNSIDEGFCIVEVLFDERDEPVDYRFLEVNEAFAQQSGISSATGRRIREIVPEHEDAWFRVYGEVAKTGEPVRFQQRAEALGGRWFDVFASRIGEPEQRRIAVLFKDETEQKRSEELLRGRAQRLALLSRAAAQLLQTEDPAAFLDRIFDELAELLDLELYVHFAVAPDRTHLRLESCRGFSDQQCADLQRLEFGEAVCGTVAQTRRPITATNVQESIDPKTELIREMGVSAYICHPLIARGELIGTLSFGSRTRSEFTEQSVRLVRTISDMVATAIARSRVERAVRESEERYRRLTGQVQDYAIFSVDIGGRITSWNEGCVRVLGYGEEEFIGMDSALLFPEEERARGVPQRELDDAAATGEASNDRWLVGKGGRRFYAAGATSAIRDEAGHLLGFSKVLRDETDWKRAEHALRESEERHRLAVEGGALGTWEMDVEAGTVLWDERAGEVFGLPPTEAVAIEEAMTAVHDEDRERVGDALRRTLEGDGHFEQEYRVVHRDGSVRWVLTRARLFRGGGGRTRLIGVVQDITDRKEHEEQMRLVMGELNHRVKNILTVVDSMAQQTLRHHPDPDAFQHSFSERIQAMAKAHSLLTAEQWRGVSLENLVMSEVRHRAASPEQIRTSGPRLVLRPRVATPLHMVLHELSTNAAKHGCLSVPGGRLDVEWGLDEGAETFWLRWRESGGPEVAEPERTGFGSKLLHRAVSYQLAGEVDAQFPPEGFRCTITIPWSQNTTSGAGGDMQPAPPA